jgi:2-polyprenyl-3-methyl-5-hydroxy-6-metoxy-1,4-benzoquinol methylase
MNFKSRNAKTHFENLAATYRLNYDEEQSGKGYEFGKRKEIVLDLVSTIKFETLLECASGSGDITFEVTKTHQHATVIVNDLSENMLRISKEKFDQLSNRNEIIYRNDDIFQLLQTSHYDADLCICLGLIAHTGNADLLFRLINDTLSKKGHLILQYTRGETFRTKFVWYINRLRNSKNTHQIEYYREQDLFKILNDNNFEIVTSVRYLIGIPFMNKLFPKLSLKLEKLLSKLATKIGSEVIILARKI